MNREIMDINSVEYEITYNTLSAMEIIKMFKHTPKQIRHYRFMFMCIKLGLLKQVSLGVYRWFWVKKDK